MGSLKKVKHFALDWGTCLKTFQPEDKGLRPGTDAVCPQTGNNFYWEIDSIKYSRFSISNQTVPVIY